MVDDLHGVVLQDADVGQLLFANALEQCAHTRLMHLAAQEVVIGAHAGDVGRGLAHAKANFENQRCRAAKGRSGVERRRGIRQDKAGAEVFKGLGLARGGAAGTAHKAFDGLGVGHASGNPARCRRGGCSGRSGGGGSGRGQFGHGAPL
ncbi:hypothetical protein D3C72_1748980 [compost metagenome]